ncbi:SDR family oxidoreductase [Pedobacter sp. WC2501]|uniref:SDR family oxidoreductase n=1 Tax=Pedobacter sp. WC2501 TaxID=3461400 RepID=UPI0040462530
MKKSPQETIEELKALGVSPLPSKMGDPEDIAYGAFYLSSDESGFVTGTELVIDGGFISK